MPARSASEAHVAPTSHFAIITFLLTVTSSSFASVSAAAAEAEQQHRRAVSRTAAAPVPFGGPTLHRHRSFRNHKNTTGADSPTSSTNNSMEEDPARGGDGASEAETTRASQSSGWIPSKYPNPRTDPLRCNIRDMIAGKHGKQVGGDTSTSTGVDEAQTGTATDGSSEGQNDNQEQGGPNEEDLLLCDPDYALGTYYLQTIASNLRNFSSSYGIGGWCAKLRQQDDWQVGVGTEGSFRGTSSGDDQTGAEDRDHVIDAGVAYGEDETRLRSLLQQSVSAGMVRDKATPTPRNQVSLTARVKRKMRKLKIVQTLHSLHRWFRPTSFPNFALISWDDEPFSDGQAHRKLEFDPSWLQVQDHTVPPSEALMAEGPVEMGVAVAMKMNLPAVLRTDIYYSYEDEDDLINDAAQYFARYLHDAWWDTGTGDDSTKAAKGGHKPSDSAPTATCGASFDSANRLTNPPAVSGILVFISVADRVCFVSTGSTVSRVLPWWRLEHVVANMKPSLRRGSYGDAILGAISDASAMLEAGPPDFQERFSDFVARFGVVIAFAAFTFLFAAWGEYRDRRRRWQYAESRSKLSHHEREEARKLQKEYQTYSCPICLENFDVADIAKLEDEGNEGAGVGENGSGGMRRVDSYGIPLSGTDGQPLKMLRCGHVFDLSCWTAWVHSGHGNPNVCPICRMDVGGGRRRARRGRSSRHGSSRSVESDHSQSPAGANSPEMGRGASLATAQAHPNYDSISQIHSEVARDFHQQYPDDAAGIGVGSAASRAALWMVPFWPTPYGSATNAPFDSTLHFDDALSISNPPVNESSALLGETAPTEQSLFGHEEDEEM